MSKIFSNKSNKHFKYKSLVVNIDIVDNKLKTSLFHAGKLIHKGFSRIKIDDGLIQQLKKIIDDYMVYKNINDIQKMQSKMSSITDDLI